MSAPRRPWEPSDEDIVYAGTQLCQIAEETWLALDYHLGFLAAKAHIEGRVDAANELLGLVDKLRGDLIASALPEAKKRATREFDVRRLFRPEIEAEDDGADRDEPTREELDEAAEIEARSRARRK